MVVFDTLFQAQGWPRRGSCFERLSFSKPSGLCGATAFQPVRYARKPLGQPDSHRFGICYAADRHAAVAVSARGSAGDAGSSSAGDAGGNDAEGAAQDIDAP